MGLWESFTGFLAGNDVEAQEQTITQMEATLQRSEELIDQGFEPPAAIDQAKTEILENNPATTESEETKTSFSFTGLLQNAAGFLANVGASFTEDVEPDPGSAGALVGESLIKTTDFIKDTAVESYKEVGKVAGAASSRIVKIAVALGVVAFGALVLIKK
jgi:hypothetical protein